MRGQAVGSLDVESATGPGSFGGFGATGGSGGGGGDDGMAMGDGLGTTSAAARAGFGSMAVPLESAVFQVPPPGAAASSSSVAEEGQRVHEPEDEGLSWWSSPRGC